MSHQARLFTHLNPKKTTTLPCCDPLICEDIVEIALTGAR
jgi:hypothetical protein